MEGVRTGARKKFQLFDITVAPGADQAMQLYFPPRVSGKRLFKRPRSQPSDFRTIGGGLPNEDADAFFEGCEDVHSLPPSLPNQLVSKQRRKAIRARCSITQRLLSEIFKRLQISLLSTPSTKRRLNTVAIFFGNLLEQSWNVFQNTSLSRLAAGLDHSSGPSSWIQPSLKNPSATKRSLSSSA